MFYVVQHKVFYFLKFFSVCVVSGRRSPPLKTFSNVNLGDKSELTGRLPVMNRPLHQRLRDLRLTAGFKTGKHFVAYMTRRGYAIDEQRYRALERGDAAPRVNEVVMICRVLGVPTDALLVGDTNIVVITGLNPKSRKALLRIADEIRNLEQ